MRKFLIGIIAMTAVTACNKDNEETKTPLERTVLIYMAAENNLTKWNNNSYYYADDDLKQIKEGAKIIGNNCLAVYVDKAESTPPYMLYYRNGELTDSIPMEETYTSDPATLEQVAGRAFRDNAASSYGLVLWGHGTGWNIKSDSVSYTSMARKKAYGGDTGNNTYNTTGKYWMNLPSMAKALSHAPHLDFIFCDCCHMACIENAYELRNVTDYLIGSAAEIPGEGAPYQTVVPAMMEKSTFWRSIVDRYYEQRSEGLDVPLAVVKTSEVATLASATKNVLQSFADKFGGEYPDMSGLIHYYNDKSHGNMYYDMNDFILKFASSDNYAAWKQAFDRAVVYKKMATRWMTNRVYYSSDWNIYYGDFTVTEQKFGGVTMFVPQWRFQNTENTTISQMGWYYAAGYEAIGW